MSKIVKKSLDHPDEVKSSDRFEVDLAKFPDMVFGRLTLRPGWRWSQDIQPLAKTASCMIQHTLYQISGVMHVRMDNGEELEFRPGDAGVIPPGHDAWVVGQEPAVSVDFTGGAGFAALT